MSNVERGPKFERESVVEDEGRRGPCGTSIMVMGKECVIRHREMGIVGVEKVGQLVFTT